MKIKILAFLLILTAFLSSCGGEKSEQGKYSFGEDTSEAAVLDDLAEYTVTRGDNSGDEEKEALVAFHDAVKKNLGIDLPVSTDWVNKIQPEHEKEIIIGESDRPAAKSATDGLGYNDFVIKKDGTKLIIAGGSGKSTLDAVNYFIKNYIDIYASTLKYPKSEYRYVQTYAIEELTVDGTDISEYKIYPLYEGADAEKLQKALSDGIVGEYLDIAEATNSYTKYIYLDNAHLVANEYGVRVDSDGNMTVFGSYDTFETALDYFETDFFEKLSSEQGKKINITERSSVTLRTGEKDIYTKETLANLLDLDIGGKIIVGEALSGSQSMPHYTLDNYFELTSKYPAVLGVELSVGGLDIKTLSMPEWSEVICELRDYAASGGIVYVKNYFTNPTGNYEKGNKSGGEIKDLNELFSVGSNTNTEFNTELALCAAFISALDKNDIPVIWRPFPEDGEYWYMNSLDKSEQKSIYEYAENYFGELGIDNIITAYDGEGGITASVTLSAGDNTAFSSTVLIETTVSRELICSTRDEQKGKFNSVDMLGEVMKLCGEYQKMSLLVTENGTSGIGWLGDADEFSEDERIITLSDMPALLENIAN